MRQGTTAAKEAPVSSTPDVVTKEASAPAAAAHSGGGNYKERRAAEREAKRLAWEAAHEPPVTRKEPPNQRNCPLCKIKVCGYFSEHEKGKRHRANAILARLNFLEAQGAGTSEIQVEAGGVGRRYGRFARPPPVVSSPRGGASGMVRPPVEEATRKPELSAADPGPDHFATAIADAATERRRPSPSDAERSDEAAAGDRRQADANRTASGTNSSGWRCRPAVPPLRMNTAGCTTEEGAAPDQAVEILSESEELDTSFFPWCSELEHLPHPHRLERHEDATSVYPDTEWTCNVCGTSDLPLWHCAHSGCDFDLCRVCGRCFALCLSAVVPPPETKKRTGFLMI